MISEYANLTDIFLNKYGGLAGEKPVGISTPQITGASAPIVRFFTPNLTVCNSLLRAVISIMVARFGRLRSAAPPVSGSTNSSRAATFSLVRKRGGYFTLIGKPSNEQ
jgi:hypothetical protein